MLANLVCGEMARHYEHWAGQDLTTELANAPHSEKVFDKFEAIGKLS
jgi:predicted heme/steroid binding protein